MPLRSPSSRDRLEFELLVAPTTSNTADRPRDTVGAQDDSLVIGNVVTFLDEDGAFFAQPVDDESLVHDFVAHVK